MRQQFLKDIADTFKTYIYANNRKAVPTSATLTVYSPASTSAIISAASMTIAADGLLSYALNAGNNAVLGESYKVVIAYIFNGITHYVNLFYDIVLCKLSITITDDDVINELPQLKDNGLKIRGAAASGSTTTIVDGNLSRYQDDYFTGGLAYSVLQDATREITGFVSSTGTVTTMAFGSAVTTDKYILTRSFTKEILRAFEKIEEKFYQAGRRSQLILDPADIKELHLYQSVAEICKGMITTEGGSMWSYFYEQYDIDKTGGKAYWAFKNLNLKYDDNNDGIISPAEVDRRIQRTIGRM